MMKRLKYLQGTPTKGFPKTGAPRGLHLPVGGNLEPFDPGDEDIRYIQNDYFGEDYFGTDYR